MTDRLMQLRVRVADPAGNITAFVMNPVPREDYAAVAKEILNDESVRAEQVAFVTGPDSMEMSGMEFCGNASRAFALMLAKKRRLDGRADVRIRVSGTDRPLTVTVVPEIDYARLAMPIHRRIVPDVLGGTLVDYGGIMHLVLDGVPASREKFDELRAEMVRRYDPPALGVMFCDGPRMTPVVYVRDVDSTYFEGSCGSGSTAYAAAHAAGRPDGRYAFEIRQPKGVIVASAAVSDGAVRKVTIESGVAFEPERTMELHLPEETSSGKTAARPSGGPGAGPESESGGFPPIEEFRGMIAEILDEFPEELFRELSGGVVADPASLKADYAKGDDLWTLGTYSVSRLGRQIRIFYGSFEKSFPSLRGEALKDEVRRTVRHEFRHHMEFLGGVHGADSLEAEDLRKKQNYLRRFEQRNKSK